MDCITNSKDVSLRSTPGFPVLHCLPELAQTHVDRVGEAIQPSHLRSFTLLLPSIFLSIRVCSNKSALRGQFGLVRLLEAHEAQKPTLICPAAGPAHSGLQSCLLETKRMHIP